jgi:glycosyltransferase involved in cell wall biosynthesis
MGVVVVRYALLSSFLPRRCGLASFAADLMQATGPAEVVAIEPAGQALAYGPEVVACVRRDVPSDYGWAADVVNARRLPLVSLQHEYGIFGGPDGQDVLRFMDAATAPVVVTCHTILREPSPSQRAILGAIVERAARVVVMSSTARRILEERYRVARGMIEVIPHGVPEMPFVSTASAKARLGLAGREVILSFGLLGPGKGYESVIDAMATVAQRRARALFVGVGATHPDLIAREGEAYRERLLERRRALDLDGHVQLIDRYLDRAELLDWLQAADVFVTPYPGLQQVTSGTLAYAMGAGKPIVSTPYAHAVELLADGHGILVEPSSAASLADALAWLLEDDERRERMARRAYARGRGMTWPVVGQAYRELFERVARPVAGGTSRVPEGQRVPA